MLRRFPIRTRLIGAFSVLVLLLVALGATGVWVASKQNEAFNGFHQRVMMSALHAHKAQTAIAEMRMHEREMVVALGSPDQVNAAGAKWKAAAATAEASLKELQGRVRDPENQARVKTFAEGLSAYTQSISAAIPLLADASQSSAATEKVIAGRAPLASAEAAMKEALTTVDRFTGVVVERVNGLYSMALTITLAVLALGVAVVVGLGWRVSLSIVQPMEAAKAFAGRIRDGDLTARIDTSGRDESAALARSLHEMQDRLRDIVGSVRASADSIHTASAEVAAGNADLSQRTEHTAANLQQTAGSIVQLTGTVSQSADSAAQANQLPTSAAEVAQRGGSVVHQVVSTMEEISGSSRKIADIIGVIDGIAFQTNILALNAAVEAARAGEQGRGFAVVASEVRSLAQRSAEAAREIKTLIGASVERVETGTRQVADAGRTMGDIVASVQRVNQIIGEISAAAADQSQGIGQVNGAVTQLDQSTQQNAALVEESAAAAESLREEAERLAQLVATFKLHAPAGA